MNCPSCQKEHDLGPVPTDHTNRIVRYVPCECGAHIRMSTLGGWDRWYAIDWFKTNEESTKLPDAPEFYQRLEASKPRP